MPAESRKIAVLTATDPDEPLLEVEVRRKIEVLLRDQGFAVGTPDESDLLLFAFFAIDSGKTASGVAPRYMPGGMARSHTYTSTGQWATTTTHMPGYTAFVPYSYTFFTRFLGVDLVEWDRWRAAPEDDKSGAIVWRAITTSAGSSSDLRSVIDYLLVATFDHFGRDTGKRIDMTLKGKDECVARLRDAIAPAESNQQERDQRIQDCAQ